MAKTFSRASKAKKVKDTELARRQTGRVARAGGVMSSGRTQAANRKPTYRVAKSGAKVGSGKNPAKTGSRGNFKNQNKRRNTKARQRT